MELIAVGLVICLGALAWSHLMGRKLPPGPYPLPIVGNIFQMSSTSPHKSLEQLAKKYGPLMSIRFGSLFKVVVSSPEMVKEVLSGQGFMERPGGLAFQAKDHYKFSFSVLPVATSEWKNMRKICHEQLFSRHSLGKNQRLRQEKVQHLLDYVQKFCGMGRTVNIREASITTLLNFMSAAFFSSEDVEFDSNASSEFKEMMDGTIAVFAKSSYADFFPILKPLDPLGLRRKADLYFGRMLGMIKVHLDQRLEFRRANPNAPKHTDLLESLIDISLGSDYEFTLDDVTHLLLELYVGTFQSIIMTIEWAMTELLRNPSMLSKVKDEVRSVLEDRKIMQDEDISRLPYLEAVIEEVLRYHPAVLFIPRAADHDREINGYFIPKGTHVTINTWAISRDPTIWRNPESFDPGRFLNNNINSKGQCFEFVPFGSGRRICPGMPLALRVVPTTIAALIHNFDWKFAEGESERNGELFTGASLHREAPLMAIPHKPGC